MYNNPIILQPQDITEILQEINKCREKIKAVALCLMFIREGSIQCNGWSVRLIAHSLDTWYPSGSDKTVFIDPVNTHYDRYSNLKDNGPKLKNIFTQVTAFIKQELPDVEIGNFITDGY